MLSFLIGLAACGGSGDQPQSHGSPPGSAVREKVQQSARHESITVDGQYLAAWSAALVAHRAIADLADEQKNIENYVFAFRDDDAHFYVIFMPKISKEPGFATGGETPLAREAHYVIEKRTYRVLSQTFSE